MNFSNDNPDPNEPLPPSEAEPVLPPPPAVVAHAPYLAPVEDPGHLLRVPRRRADRIYFGPNGLRAGWRLVIFFAVLNAIMLVLAYVRSFGPDWLGSPLLLSVSSPAYFLVVEPLAFMAYFLAALAMGRIEGRSLAAYGLPLSKILGRNFWTGALLGIATLSALLVEMKVAGGFEFGSLALHGTEIVKYGLVWAVAFFLVALQEDFRSRGYVLFTLSTGIGFWPAALATAIWFGYTHVTNPGETTAGLISIGTIAIFFCILIRRTGDLWLAMGFHAAWDWGMTFLYGVPDSGLAENGHLLNPTFYGPDWLTGGSAGPEGSYLCIALVAALCIAAALWLPDAKYPDPAAIADPRRRREVAQSALASS